MIEGRMEAAGSIVRVPAEDIQRVVIQAISALAKFEAEARAVEEQVGRISIQPTFLGIALNPKAAEIAGREFIVADGIKPPFRVKREVLLPADGERDDPRAMSFDTPGPAFRPRSARRRA